METNPNSSQYPVGSFEINNKEMTKVLEKYVKSMENLHKTMDDLPIDLKTKTTNLTNFLIKLLENTKEIKIKYTKKPSNEEILSSIKITVQTIEFFDKSNQLIIGAKYNHEKAETIQEDLQNEITNFEQKQQKLLESNSKSANSTEKNFEVKKGWICYGSKKNGVIKFFEIPPNCTKIINEKGILWRKNDKIISPIEITIENAQKYGQVNLNSFDIADSIEYFQIGNSNISTNQTFNF